jgi:hypothetical protein
VVSSADAAAGVIAGVIAGAYNGAGAMLIAADLYADGDMTDAYAILDTDARYGTFKGGLIAVRTLAGRATHDFPNWATLATAYGKQLVSYEGGYEGAAFSSSFAEKVGGSWSSPVCSIFGTILTVGAVTGQVYYGAPVTGVNVAAGTYVTGQLTGTPGGAGTYSVNKSQIVGPAGMNGPGVDSRFGTNQSTLVGGSLQTLINAYKHSSMFERLVLDGLNQFIASSANALVPSWYTFQAGPSFWQITPSTIDLTPYYRSYDAIVAFGS